MPAANLRREERFGLAVAVGAHIALLVALAVHANREPAQVPLPERMVVSLADEVSLRSTAPDPSLQSQAAIADTLSDTPDPAPEVKQAVEPPRVVPVEQPRVAPVQQPRTAPVAPPVRSQARPEPRREPPQPASRRGGGSRLGNDFLAGQSTSERSDDARAPASEIGASVKASLFSQIAREIRPHWKPPSGADAEKLVSVIRFRLNSDGSLAGNPTLVTQRNLTDSNRPQAGRHAELAIRAVQLAAPFDLPEEYYEAWKVVGPLDFDWKLSQ